MRNECIQNMMGGFWDWMKAYIYDRSGLICVNIQNYSDNAI